jgi:hypothetical protein
MMLDTLLALGLAMSSATQLRLPGLPLGPGESCILLWIGLSSFGLLAGRGPPQTAALLRLVTFWSFFGFALSIGAFVGLMVEYHVAIAESLHDASAYLLMAVMTCLTVANSDASVRLRRMCWLLILFSSAVIAIQIGAGWNVIDLPSVDPWYWDRFRGWSENPNQLAISCCVTSLLALHLAATSVGFGRVLGLLGAIAPLIAGRLSKSDTFISVMILSCAVLLALRLRHWLTAPRPGSNFRYALALLLVIFAIPAAATLIPYGQAESGSVENFALGLAKDKGGDASERTLDLRLYLWKQAAMLGIESGSLGLGPGPHLKPPDSTVARVLDNPFEAHSTPLDIFLQGGVFGLAALFGFIASTAVLVYRARLDVLVALIVAIVSFSMTHFVIRHPVVWFALALCVSTGCTHTSLALGRNGGR